MFAHNLLEKKGGEMKEQIAVLSLQKKGTELDKVKYNVLKDSLWL